MLSFFILCTFIEMKILVVYTGGTIGMINDSDLGVLKPGGINGIQEFLEKESLIEFCDLKSTNDLIDSSDFNQKYYKDLSVIIKNSYQDYDAFLVLMGTDTMAYISSLLSFCISGLSKSIVFTGGQKTLYEAYSDSKTNLREAVLGLKNNEFPNEVGIYFSGNWHRAVCTTKNHSKANHAYTAVSNRKYLPNIYQQFDVVTEVSANVVIVKLTPFDDENVLLALLDSEKINAIILEIFGSGNMPKLSTRLKNKFKQRIDEGLKVVITSQCMYGGLDVGRYQSSLSVSSLGFLNAGSMTKEAIVAKLIFMLEKKLNIQEFCLMFENSIRGE